MSDQAGQAAPRDTAVDETVAALERELKAHGVRRWLRRGLGVLGIAALVGAASLYQRVSAPPPPPRFVTRALEQRDVIEQVQSTGNVKPLTEVQVGAQVSGRVVKIYADFNSKVKEGDLLAEIDPTLFGAQVSQSGAQLRAARAAHARAKASLATHETTVRRLTELSTRGLTAQSELDQATGARDVARADVASAAAQIAQIRAQLSSAQTTLAYAKIYSPIDGVVISRAVDPGQTVAASFSAPVLFVIAQDLRKMQVMAEIDEADVGRLEEKMAAEVLVDAFPGEKFRGLVSQVRFSPNNVQGVVTYAAVIDVDNPDLKLRPGMTATVTIRTREALKVVAIPNAALRFRPVQLSEEGEQRKTPLTPTSHEQGRVYLMEPGAGTGEEEARELVVGVGITDGMFTVLTTGELRAGDPVIVDQPDAKPKRGFRLF